MKKYFFLGIGVGLILAGIFNNFENKNKLQTNNYKKIESKSEIINNHPIKISKIPENRNDIELQKLLNDNKQKKNVKNIENIAKKVEPQKEISENKYLIQLGAYGKLENASELKNKISNIQLKIIKKDNIYKVVTKNLLTKKNANKYVIILKNDYNIDAYIKIIR